jgi:hypothetical protein
VLEDDHLARSPARPGTHSHPTEGVWAVVRSASKWLGPDLRVPRVVAGDELTLSAVEGRQSLGPGLA